MIRLIPDRGSQEVTDQSLEDRTYHHPCASEQSGIGHGAKLVVIYTVLTDLKVQALCTIK